LHAYLSLASAEGSNQNWSQRLQRILLCLPWSSLTTTRNARQHYRKKSLQGTTLLLSSLDIPDNGRQQSRQDGKKAL
jgi:hypothetical protein